MSVNSSSEFLLLASVTASSFPFGLDCLLVAPFYMVLAAYAVTTGLLLLPVCLLVLYHGFQRCTSTAAASTGHSDSFTYHLVAMEIVFVLGCSICCCGIYTETLQVAKAGIYIFTVTWYGEVFFHVLTCVELYLAVVHPVVYLSLREERWVRVRHVGVVCVWLFSVGGTALITLDNICVVLIFCILISALFVISFCCVSVLCALIRPRPGSQSRVDQSKQKAFYSIAAILAVLLLRCAWNLVWVSFYVSRDGVGICVFVMCEMWINFPSCLVLPLLFLQRAGALARCRNGAK